MLKKSTQKQYLVHQWENLETQFDHFCERADADALHQFRVSAKRIHSFLNLQSVCQPKSNDLGYFKSVREIFKHAGKIREAQIHLANLERLKIKEPSIKNELNDRIGYQTAKFELKRRWYRQAMDASLEEIRESLLPIADDLAASFLNRDLHLLAKNCRRKYFLGTLHDSRKSIKRIQHLRELFPDLQLNWEYLERLQRNIGTWHDLHRTYLFIYYKGASAKNCTTIRNAQQEMVQEIKAMIRKFGEEIKLEMVAEQD